MYKKRIMKPFISVPDLAQQMGISRIAVFKKIKNGNIDAQKIGRNYVISKGEAERALGIILGKREKDSLTKAVKKAVKEYGPALLRLGKE